MDFSRYEKLRTLVCANFSEQTRALVDEALEYADGKLAGLVRYDGSPLLEHAAELFQHHAARQKVSLAVDVREALPDINVDESRMMQVLDNLISNALHYTPEGGTITLGGQQKAGKVELTVQDTGSGIPQEELGLIFNRFHRVDSSRHTDSGESGLGLAIVKALVEAHGGQVWAESVLGQGTTMHISLPAGL